MLEPAQLNSTEATEYTTVIDPLSCPQWDGWVSNCKGRSFFHRSSWAQVLQKTYGHQPVYFCRFINGAITGVLPVMEVSSLWAGRKGVSLPFTDLCGPLQSKTGDARALYSSAVRYGREHGWGVLECRSSATEWPGSSTAVAFLGHIINLEGGTEAVFHKFKSPVRCAIRKAERAGVRIQFSTSLESMRDFYRLHCLARSRYGMPCQPFRFFENIARFMLSEDCGFIATALYEGLPIAAAVFFQDGPEAFFKFGASDYAFQHLRPNNLVIWESIKRCLSASLTRLNLGRTSLKQHGLRRFKLGFGAIEEPIDYVRYNLRKGVFVKSVDYAECWLNNVFRRFPAPVLRMTGHLLYPHLT